MKVVFLVIIAEDNTVDGAFSSKKKAQEHLDELIEYSGEEDVAEIKEFEVK